MLSEFDQKVFTSTNSATTSPLVCEKKSMIARTIWHSAHDWCLFDSQFPNSTDAPWCWDQSVMYFVLFCAVVKEFSRIAIEFVKKGSNPKMYTAASRKSIWSTVASSRKSLLSHLLLDRFGFDFLCSVVVITQPNVQFHVETNSCF